MSTSRYIRRRAAEKSVDGWQGKEQVTEFDEKTGGYRTLTPTKGWKRVSGARVRAQQTMLMKYGFIR